MYRGRKLHTVYSLKTKAIDSSAVMVKTFHVREPTISQKQYIRLDELTKLISQVGFLFTTILGMLFVCLTVCFLKRDFGSYRNLLIVFSFLGFLFSSSEYLIHPMIHSYNSGFVFFTEPRLPLVSNEIMKIGLVFFCGIYGSTVCFISVQFLYRYWALFDAPKLIWFEGWMMSAWFLYSFGIGTTWSIGIHYFLENDNFTLNYFEDGVYDHYGWKLSAIPSFTSVIYTESGAIRWRNLACTIEMTLIIGLQYSIICFCGRKMSVGMKEKISMLSETSKRLHTQFFKALILQIVVPTILLFFPMIIIIYLPVFNLKFSFPTGILFSAFAIYPSIDIAIILYIVSDYRIAIKLLLKSIKSVMLSSSFFSHELSLPTCTPQTPLPAGTARI